MLLTDITLSQIVKFLNSQALSSTVVLITSIGVGIILLFVIYHWIAYLPGTSIKLSPDEHKVKVFYKHWLIFFFDLLLIVVLAFIPKAASLMPKEFTDFLSMIQPFLDVLYSAWLAILGTGALVMATDYFLDNWILTNKRIVDVEQKGLFHRDIAELRLEKIEDIHIKVSGLIGTIFGIGTVEVESAGAAKEFSLRHIANPEDARTKISTQASAKLDEIKKVQVV
jgi:hypothetical protein